MSTHTFDPKEVIVTIGGAIIGGYADGEYINLTRRSDAFSESSGADGDVTRVKSNDKLSDLTLTLAQSSLSNDALSVIAKLDEKSNQGIVPCIIKEVNGTTTIFAGKAWIKKEPDVIYGKDISTRAWAIVLAETESFVGGNPAL